MKEALKEQYNSIIKHLQNQPKRELVYYMSEKMMKEFDRVIMEYAKVNNLTTTNDKTTNSK